MDLILLSAAAAAKLFSPTCVSPDDKRLGARPARPLQGWIALMTKKLGDLRRVALRRVREILACKFGGPPRALSPFYYYLPLLTDYIYRWCTLVRK